MFKNSFLEKFSKKIAGILGILILVISMLGTSTLTSYASSDFHGAGVVYTSSGKLNVRSSSSTSSTIKKQLTKGTYVTLVSKSGSWWKIKYGSSSYGYCSANYINEVSSTVGYVNTASTGLNIRSRASTSASIICVLAKGTDIVVIGSSGNFHKILYNGSSIGYAHKDYIAIYGSGNNSGGAQNNTSSTISLNVPSYKQFDSRWRGHYIGNSGKTIYQIGCLTTCFAMNESYMTGTTVYPDEMETRLKYTSGGSAYWPTNYSFYTSSDYLNKILTELKEGDAVIIGSKNAYGSQHWVVVTGYTKNGTITADDFKINDPGSSSRTTLSQFLAAYPNFYKLAIVK